MNKKIQKKISFLSFFRCGGKEIEIPMSSEEITSLKQILVDNKIEVDYDGIIDEDTYLDAILEYFVKNAYEPIYFYSSNQSIANLQAAVDAYTRCLNAIINPVTSRSFYSCEIDRVLSKFEPYISNLEGLCRAVYFPKVISRVQYKIVPKF